MDKEKIIQRACMIAIGIQPSFIHFEKVNDHYDKAIITYGEELTGIDLQQLGFDIKRLLKMYIRVEVRKE